MNVGKLQLLVQSIASGEERTGAGWASRLAAREEGMLTLTVGVVLIGFVVLFGLVGNVGRITKEKMEIQNAADATAYSSALWMARGMNAVTTTNHLLGELTAVCVLHEAIGGKLLDSGQRGDATEVQFFNNAIKGIQAFGVSPDAAFVQLVVRRVTQDDSGPTAGAMLYDARIRLKFYCMIGLGAKALGNALIATGFGAGLGATLHVAGSVLLAKVLQEWELLNFLEIAAKVVSGTAKPAIQNLLVPALATYQSAVVGQGGVSLLGPAVDDSVRQLAQQNGVEAVLYPAPLALSLPLQKEPSPRSGSGEPQVLLRNYGIVPDFFEALNSALQPATSLIRSLVRLIANDLVRKFMPSSVVDKIDKLDSALGQLEEQQRRIAAGDGTPGNPSKKQLNDMQVDWSYESRSQWTRATYPYVDSFRRPFVESLNSLLGAPLSNAGTWYMQWTSRFTLSKSVEFRRGEFGGRSLQMHTMVDFDRKRKGYEPWTDDSRRAERLFTVIAFARRDEKTIIAPSIFGEPSPEAIVAYGQAIVYNANDQQPGGSADRQPRVGWDTLNWDPSQPPPEFDNPTKPSGGGGAPWDAFLKWDGGPPVKLNWQAKLVPVTQSRLREAVPALSGDFRSSLTRVPLSTSRIDTH